MLLLLNLVYDHDLLITLISKSTSWLGQIQPLSFTIWPYKPNSIYVFTHLHKRFIKLVRSSHFSSSPSRPHDCWPGCCFHNCPPPATICHPVQPPVVATSTTTSMVGPPRPTATLPCCYWCCPCIYASNYCQQACVATQPPLAAQPATYTP